MASAQNRSELDRKAQEGQTVVPGGTGGKSLEAQEHLAQGRQKGGETRKQQLGTEGYKEMGSKGGRSTGTYEDEDAGDVPDDPEDDDYTPPAENTRSKT